MKKLLAFIIAAAMLLSMVACGGGEKENDTEKEDIKATEPVETKTPEEDKKEEKPEKENDGDSAPVQVDEGLLMVDVTLAASLFEDMTEEEIIADAKEEGVSKCVVNEDGSVTYTMSKRKHTEMLDDMKKSLDELFVELVQGESKVASFTEIKANEDYSEISIYVDRAAFTVWDMMYGLTFYVSGAYYQSFAGVAAEDIDIVVKFIDNATQEVVDTMSYKEFMANAAESETAQ